MSEKTLETDTYTGALTFTRNVNVPASQVYHAFTNATALREWLCDLATLVPRPGGRLYLAWNDGYYSSGEFTKLEKDRAVGFTWLGRGEPKATNVHVTLSEMNGGTEIRLGHSGLGSGEGWTSVVEEFRKGWETGLENLKSVMETGEDLRITRRPMLGIMVGEYNAETAAKLGVPTDQGIHLDSTLEGMGARAAGLERDDVIVQMGDRPVRDFAELTAALQGHFAGDKVEVTYYHGAEKRTTTMELSRRPLPEIPKTAHELAEIVKNKYAQIDAEIENIFRGVTEEEASFKPAPDEWSAKEILAHLISGERFTPYYISELVYSQERWSDDYGGNYHPQTSALVAAYPTVNDLLQEFKRNQVETVHILETLGEDFLGRKGTYWRLAFNFVQPDYHAEQHYDQIRQAIQAGRNR